MKNKKYLLLFVILYRFINVQAQTFTLTEVKNFIMGHTLTYNQSLHPINCDNLDSLIDCLKKSKISYSNVSYMFLGKTINDENMIGGGADAFMFDKHQPFIYYRIVKGDLGLTIEAIEGHNYL
jgi:hypothetical protein